MWRIFVDWRRAEKEEKDHDHLTDDDGHILSTYSIQISETVGRAGEGRRGTRAQHYQVQAGSGAFINFYRLAHACPARASAVKLGWDKFAYQNTSILFMVSACGSEVQKFY